MDEKMDEKAPEQPSSELSETGYDGEDVSLINEGALIRKLDLRLLPAVTILYLMSFLDRSNGMMVSELIARIGQLLKLSVAV